MKKTIIFTLILLSNELYAQKESRFVFYNPCNEQTIELNYELWYPDSTIQIAAGQLVNLDQEYYLLSTQLKSNINDWIATFDFDIYTKNIGTIDTLYLYELRSMWNGLLHPQKVEFYFCDQKCNGKIEERDSNGVLRATGKFKNGIPESNIKFFDEQGNLESKWIYANGKLQRIKK
ncbi:MAG: hypothetical protein AAFX87_20805 [Bacteroidota bacterium]